VVLIGPPAKKSDEAMTEINRVEKPADWAGVSAVRRRRRLLEKFAPKALAVGTCLAAALGGIERLAVGQERQGTQRAARIEQSPQPTSYRRDLYGIGAKLGCYFTVETRAFVGMDVESQLDRVTTNELNVGSITALLPKLRGDLDAFTIRQDEKNPKIIHVIQTCLLEDKDYVLDKRITLAYRGSLMGYNKTDKRGHVEISEGLVGAIAKKTGGLESGPVPVGSFGLLGGDTYTRVSVNATNETVRSVLTDSVPLANYRAVLWQAVATKEEGKVKVYVQFLGPKQKP
jgi:hypothetical protein